MEEESSGNGRESREKKDDEEQEGRPSCSKRSRTSSQSTFAQSDVVVEDEDKIDGIPVVCESQQFVYQAPHPKPSVTNHGYIFPAPCGPRLPAAHANFPYMVATKNVASAEDYMGVRSLPRYNNTTIAQPTDGALDVVEGSAGAEVVEEGDYAQWLATFIIREQMRHECVAICDQFHIAVPPPMLVEDNPLFPRRPTPPSKKYTLEQNDIRLDMLVGYRKEVKDWSAKHKDKWKLALDAQYGQVYEEPQKTSFDKLTKYVHGEVTNSGNRIRRITGMLRESASQKQIESLMKEKDDVEKSLTDELNAKIAECEKTKQTVLQEREKAKENLAAAISASVEPSNFRPSTEIQSRLTRTVNVASRQLAQSKSKIFDIPLRRETDGGVEFEFAKTENNERERVQLGSGFFGKVFLGVHRDQTCAIKVFSTASGGGYKGNLDAVVTGVKLEQSILEIAGPLGFSPRVICAVRSTSRSEVHDALLMENVVSYHHLSAKFKIGTGICGPLPVCMNLRQYWAKISESKIFFCTEMSMEKVLSFLFTFDIAEALGFIHGKGIIHCDMKPSNILVKAGAIRMRCLLCDFGSAVHTDDFYTQQATHTSSKSMFTVTKSLPKEREWCPPELIGPSPLPSNQATDMFAYGYIVLEGLKHVWASAKPDVDEAHFLRSVIVRNTYGRAKDNLCRANLRYSAAKVCQLFKEHMQDRMVVEPKRYNRVFNIYRESSYMPDNVDSGPKNGKN